MFCSKCGAEIPEGAQWCPNCGAQQSTPTQTLQRPESQTQTAPGSVAGFILSLAGFLADWVPVAGLVLSIIGTVICGKGCRESRCLYQHRTAYSRTHNWYYRHRVWGYLFGYLANIRPYLWRRNSYAV